jgi:hypothetical protein
MILLYGSHQADFSCQVYCVIVCSHTLELSVCSLHATEKGVELTGTALAPTVTGCCMTQAAAQLAHGFWTDPGHNALQQLAQKARSIALNKQLHNTAHRLTYRVLLCNTRTLSHSQSSTH